jgi:hypothetical protein
MSIGYQSAEKLNTKKLTLIVVGVSVALIVMGIIYLLNTPDGDVKMANEMEPYATEYIKTHHLLNKDEELIAYYDATLVCDGTEAAILTTQNLKYHKNGATTIFPLKNIQDISYNHKKILGDIIEVENKDGKFMKIEIAVLNAKSFYTALKRNWERSQKNYVLESRQ